ncbi:carbohydrate porin [Piscinibacter gummiphilus]|uniref:Carbohydrate porin n=1 Tax=Piscinibacter gummiphilus TaxID=946333 RepID=A0ABZ0CTZ8_9BURK|nr:carbohydrate porin [Piscinibacter gummiphilus]WOB08450.1 carbohydrate porin [Piscinibacter gummiphilus]
MKTLPLFTALALAGAAGSALAAPPIEFSGYFRAGVGINTRGGNQVCYGLSGADTKFRLGNECDYVVEPTFDAKLAEYEGSDWHVRVMPSVYKGWDSGNAANNGNGPDQLTTRFGQIYAYGQNISQLANGRVWAGRRFYNRLQTGINDQFLENNDGNGAGVEDMDLGIGKLSVAFMMDPNNDAYNNRFALPIRMTGIKDMPNGELSIYVTPSKQLKTANQEPTPPGPAVEPAAQANGLAVGIYQKLNGVILGGDTLFGVKADKQGELKNTRVVFQQGMSMGGTAIDFITEYRVRKNKDALTGADTGNKWFMIGARTDTHLSGPFRFLAEVGHDQVKPDGGGATQNLTKGTLAVAASAGKEAGSRPTVRLFVTHAIWNDAVRTAGGLSSTNTRQVFGDKKSGTSVGVQAESWW